MTYRRGWLHLLGLGLIAAAGTGLSGCMSCLHPIEPVTAEQSTLLKSFPPCCHNHVYIFMIHGVDPLDYANLAGVRDYLHDLGFRKIYLGQLYHTPGFDKEIHRLHREDPCARFVLVGFSFGANMIRTLAHSAKADGITIDLMVYLGGNTLHNTEKDQPDNALQIINILASGCIWNGCVMSRAQNIDVPDVYHFGSPSHPGTLEMLRHELAIVTARVPVQPPPACAPPLLAPKAEPPLPPAAVRGEWDFLKPTAHLGGQRSALSRQ
jgi:hypothetical protein